MKSAAKPIQGAVFLPFGSIIIFSGFKNGNWRLISSAWGVVETTITFSCFINGLSLATVL